MPATGMPGSRRLAGLRTRPRAVLGAAAGRQYSIGSKGYAVCLIDINANMLVIRSLARRVRDIAAGVQAWRRLGLGQDVPTQPWPRVRGLDLQPPTRSDMRLLSWAHEGTA